MTGQWVNATMNADGTVLLEVSEGDYPLGSRIAAITLNAQEVANLSAVLNGITGTVSLASHLEP